MKWQVNIHGLLRRIPSISRNGMNTYFDSIGAKLSFFESLADTPMLLELALWKSKIIKQFNWNIHTLAVDMKMECRAGSLTIVAIIVPNALPFLTDGDSGTDGVGCDSVDDSDSGSDDSFEDDEEWADGNDDDYGDDYIDYGDDF
jgi:hypothetical protein